MENPETVTEDQIGARHRAHSLRAAGVEALLEHRPAVVVERLAYGGGATNWYFVAESADVSVLAGLLRRGSRVDFFFSSALSWVDLETDASMVSKVLRDHGEVVVGRRTPSIELDVMLVGEASELLDLTKECAGELVLAGAYPQDGRDGDDVVTVDMPDDDGEIRTYPR